MGARPTLSPLQPRYGYHWPSPLFSVPTKIHMALGCSYEVKGLPNLCLIGALQKERQQVQVVGLLPAVQLQQQ